MLNRDEPFHFLRNLGFFMLHGTSITPAIPLRYPAQVGPPVSAGDHGNEGVSSTDPCGFSTGGALSCSLRLRKFSLKAAARRSARVFCFGGLSFFSVMPHNYATRVDPSTGFVHTRADIVLL
jgi:hypothetical protein